MDDKISIHGNTVRSNQGFFDISGAESFSVKNDTVSNIKNRVTRLILEAGAFFGGVSAYQAGHEGLSYILFGYLGIQLLFNIFLGGSKSFTDGMVVMNRSGKSTTLFKGTVAECELALEKLASSRTDVQSQGSRS